MNKTDKVGVSELENLYQRYNDKETVILAVGEGKDKFEFEVKRRISAEDAARIVAAVWSGIYDAHTGSYKPELKDYFLRVAVLNAYTNLTLPEDGRCWNLVYGTPIFAMVTGHERRLVIFGGWEYDDNMVIDVEQYEQIIAAVDQKISYAIKRSTKG